MNPTTPLSVTTVFSAVVQNVNWQGWRPVTEIRANFPYPHPLIILISRFAITMVVAINIITISHYLNILYRWFSIKYKKTSQLNPSDFLIIAIRNSKSYIQTDKV